MPGIQWEVQISTSSLHKDPKERDTSDTQPPKHKVRTSKEAKLVLSSVSNPKVMFQNCHKEDAAKESAESNDLKYKERANWISKETQYI